jgi:hypothetical protein
MTLGARFFLVGIVFMLSGACAEPTGAVDVVRDVLNIGSTDTSTASPRRRAGSKADDASRRRFTTGATPEAAGAHRVVDLLWRGRVPNRCSLPAQARRVRGILDALSVEKSIVIGNTTAAAWRSSSLARRSPV